MPDITMCKWEWCPMKDKCYRYTAKPSEMQSYFIETPIEDWKCEYFWEDKSTKQEKKKE